MSDCDAKALFVEHGLRSTRQREQVYCALRAAKSHPTAEDLFHLVRERAPGISLATIYNTLDALTRVGLCRRLAPTLPDHRGGAFRYDADLGDHAHVVTADGTILDLPIDLSDTVLSHIPPDVVAQIEARTGVKIDHLSVEFIELPKRGALRQNERA